MNRDYFIERSKELFTKNWKVKLGSLFLAVIFYVNLQNSKILVKNINIPIDYPKLESGLYYSKDPDKTFPIRVEGMREVVNYYSQFMKAHPDFVGLVPGENKISIKNISGVPNGIKVTRLKKNISIELEKITNKQILIDVGFQDELPENYEKVSYRINPSKVTIAGRQSNVEKISKINLGSISLKDVTESFVKRMRIPDLPKGVYVVGGTKQATVSVTISSQGSKSGEQIITGIPLRCIDSSPLLEPELSVEQVSVKIDTKAPVKTSSIINGINATVPCNYSYDPVKKRILPNDQPVVSKIRVSRSRDLKNIEILQVIPDRVTISYKVKETTNPAPDTREEETVEPEKEDEKPLPPPPEGVELEEPVE